MQFFFLLLFNVFLGAVLYLIISLKLERTATEYRERRFRKEMDEIISEFNLTAERNITILESRIRIMRRLLEQSGDLKSIDLVMEGEERDPAPVLRREAEGNPVQPSHDRNGELDGAVMKSAGKAALVAGHAVKKGLLLLFDRFIAIFPRTETGRIQLHADSGEDDGPLTIPAEAGPEARECVPVLIEKDMRVIAPMSIAEPPAEERKPLTESEIEEIVGKSEDKYAMVSILFEGGCGIDDISRHSGIPAGEVRLVLNLNRQTSTDSY